MQEKVQSTMEDFKEVVDYFQYSGEGEEVLFLLPYVSFLTLLSEGAMSRIFLITLKS